MILLSQSKITAFEMAPNHIIYDLGGVLHTTTERLDLPTTAASTCQRSKYIAIFMISDILAEEQRSPSRLPSTGFLQEYSGRAGSQFSRAARRRAAR